MENDVDIAQIAKNKFQRQNIFGVRVLKQSIKSYGQVNSNTNMQQREFGVLYISELQTKSHLISPFYNASAFGSSIFSFNNHFNYLTGLKDI